VLIRKLLICVIGHEVLDLFSTCFQRQRPMALQFLHPAIEKSIQMDGVNQALRTLDAIANRNA
jgi:hypothetical protein